MLGLCYRQTNDYEKAESFYLSAQKLKPNDLKTLQELAYIYEQDQHNTDKLIGVYQKLLVFYQKDV